jgi:HSP90 family molecular chaperone
MWSIFPGNNEDYESEETKQEYTLLCKWVHQQLCDKVDKVQVSKSLCSSPCVLEFAKYGLSTNMKALKLGDTSKFMRGWRVFKINPDHPIFKDLNVRPSASRLPTFKNCCTVYMLLTISQTNVSINNYWLVASKCEFSLVTYKSQGGDWVSVWGCFDLQWTYCNAFMCFDIQ